MTRTTLRLRAALLWILHTPQRAAVCVLLPVIAALTAVVLVLSTTGGEPGASPGAPPTQSSQPVPPADSGPSQRDAQTTAAHFVAAWVNTGHGQASWERGMRPYLTPNAAEEFHTASAARVPAKRLTGQFQQMGTGDGSALVAVGTDHGLITVHLTQVGDRWYVARLTPGTQARE